MDEIIRNLGFSDGFSIPVADDENKVLEEEIQKQKKEREKLISLLEEEEERFKAVKNHLENINWKQEQNLKALFEYDCQIRSGESAFQLVENQVRNFDAEDKDLAKNMDELLHWQEATKNETERIVFRLNHLNVQVEWNQAALEAWTSAAGRMAEDYSMLEQFAEQDRVKFNHLELKRQHLRQEVGSKRARFEVLNADVLSLEQSLEKVGSLFMSQHNDRQALVDQWHGAVRVLHQRDEDIRRAVEEIGSLRTQAKQRMRESEEHKTFLANEERNNKEMDLEANRLNREFRDTADTVRELESDVSNLNGQFLVERGALTSAARLVQENRSTCRAMSEQIMKKRQICMSLEQKLEELEMLIRDSYGKTHSASRRVSHLDDIKKATEDVCQKLGWEHAKLQEKVRLISEELLRLRTAEKEQRGMMTGLESSIQNLRHRITSALTEQQRQQDILYKADINFLDKDIQYRRMLGRVDPEEKERCEKKLQELESAMKDCQETHLLLDREVYRLDQEYRRLCTTLEADSAELNGIRQKRQELMLLTEGGAKRVAVLRSTNQDLQVDENVVQLRVKHLEKTLRHVGNRLYSLEKERLELDEAVKERSLDVEALLEVLNVRKRAHQEQLSELNTNINIAKLKVEHLETRYVLSMQSFGTTEEGDVMSVTALKIQAAQERYELQQMGDKLDGKIRTTEREITAMENTLKVMHVANSTYKYNLSKLPTDGPELEEKVSLEAAYVTAVEALGEKRNFFQNLQENFTKIQDSLQAQLELESRLLKEAGARANEVTDLDRKLEAQVEKQNRAARDLRMSIKQLHGLVKSDFQTPEEKDISLRELREMNQSGLQQLGEVAPRVMEAAPVVTRYLRERGLSLPQPSSRRSTSSRASSIIATSSCYTIDSLTLGKNAEKKQTVPRRRSILKNDKKSVACNKPSIDSKLTDTMDIVELVLPQPK